MYIANQSVNIGTKTSGASEKVRIARKGNVSSAKQFSKLQEGEFGDLIANIMEPRHPFLLPRTVPTSAAVMFHKCQKSVHKDLSAEPNGYAIVRPNVDSMLTLSSLEEAGPISPSVRGDSGVDPQNLTNLIFSIGVTPKKVDGTRIPVNRVTNVNYRTIAPGGVWETAYAEYRNLSWLNTSTIALRVDTNCNSGVVGTLRVYRNGVTYLTASPVANASGTFTHTFTMPSASSGSLRFHFQVDGEDWKATGDRLGFTDFTYLGGYVTDSFSLWDLLSNRSGASTSRSQYYNAEKISMTAFSMLMRNTTASQYKSGSVVSCQFPGGSEHLLPTDPTELYSYVASYNDPKVYGGQLNHGVHWFFSPEKVQDWYFHDLEANSELPYCVVAWSGVAVNDLANMLGLTFEMRTNIELLTTDISLMKFTPSSDLTRLMDLYITLVNAHNTIGENPDHLKKIGKIVKSIITNPHVKRALVHAGETGRALLPLVLAAI